MSKINALHYSFTASRDAVHATGAGDAAREPVETGNGETYPVPFLAGRIRRYIFPSYIRRELNRLDGTD
jgi:hypothetical protein